MANGVLGLALGASALGLTHGLAPGHGWAIAASYALDKQNKWFYGAASSLILGIGHLISSIAMVVVYFWALSYFDLTQIPWMNYVAGALLIALGIWQYFNGHNHTASNHDGDHSGHHGHDDHDHAHNSHDHSHSTDDNQGWIARVRRAVPFVGQSDHPHSHDHLDEASDRGLYGMVALAFALGFTHNEEFDIIAICTGSTYCLELMLLYSLAVITSLVGVTLVLVAGYQRYEDRLEDYAEYLPAFTATILIVMGTGFILGIF
jgi:nickel/cobalt exporter